MIVFEFGLQDLARTRFAISPMYELIASLRAIREPDEAALHLPWVREAIPIAAELDLATAFALIPTKPGYIPDFLTPPPTTPVASFEDELELVRTTPPAQVGNDVGWLLEGRKPPPSVSPLLEEPRRALDRLATSLGEFWRLALEPHWPRIRALLEADLAYRSQRLTQGGPALLFTDLNPAVRWLGDRIEVDQQHEAVVPLRDQGLLLVPSAFRWEKVASITEAPWQPTLLYPARGVGLLWEPGAPSPGAGLASVLGQTRATMLASLDAPASTTQLAARLRISPGGVSQHLMALREAGLVAGQRQGRSVLYARTALGDRMLESTATVG
jgi:DNA-binding transcriptional ArsR family regulator